MIDFVARIIGSGNDFPTILMGVIVYVALLWFLFSFWVFIDAKKRYKNTKLGVVFFLVVLIFNFPALVFYLLVRPEDEGEFVVLPADHLHNKGINVPVVNFIGKDGIVNLSFELRISNEALVGAQDMAINIDWKSDKKEFEKVNNVEVKKEEVKTINDSTEKKSVISFENQKRRAANTLSYAKNKFKSFRPAFKKSSNIGGKQENKKASKKDK